MIFSKEKVSNFPNLLKGIHVPKKKRNLALKPFPGSTQTIKRLYFYYIIFSFAFPCRIHLPPSCLRINQAELCFNFELKVWLRF